MIVLKLKKAMDNNLDMIAHVLSIYCIMKDIKVNDTDLQVLAYLAKYSIKRSTKEMIVRSQILTRSSLENTMCKLRRLGLIVKDLEEYPILIPDLRFGPETKIGIMIQLENT